MKEGRSLKQDCLSYQEARMENRNTHPYPLANEPGKGHKEQTRHYARKTR